ncbi:VF530 family protein [Chitinimonas sp. PSY-7]|uniref:VF530 family DNA-binding protein n=1 Tax=Chitinimonas sp. PSY-7 TaxID=3459088 RepID=UPI0040402D4B
MTSAQVNNTNHGVTLEKMLTTLVEFYGWKELGQRIEIRCFQADPTIKSSLTFLRRTPWAREKVEGLYGKCLRDMAKQAKAKPDPT